ncbi:hypothetical protein GGX14DRAFT_406536 [Mycena pura]|uniref:Uncharacterized protein n=1 Tax=Mycena pura TaxID=153505 RepID=A0AAD6UQI6_9AGAR|nr:hypothetical protein GGX14DRAFT_406536 [Mycena pura]
MAFVCDDKCFPDPYFTPADVTITPEGKTVIDISSDDAPADRSDDSYEGPAEDEVYIPPPYTGPRAPCPVPRIPHTIARVISRIFQAARDALLISLLGLFISGTELERDYARPRNICERLPNGMFVLRRPARLFLEQRLISCAGLIATALNHYPVGLHGFIPEDVPVTVPRPALDEVQVPFPVILVFLSREWTLTERSFESMTEAEEHAKDILLVLRYGIAFFGKIMLRTMEGGPNSVCNPGAGLQVSQDEFLERSGLLDDRARETKGSRNNTSLARFKIQTIFHMSNCPRRLTILSMDDSGGAIAAQLAALGVALLANCLRMMCCDQRPNVLID